MKTIAIILVIICMRCMEQDYSGRGFEIHGTLKGGYRGKMILDCPHASYTTRVKNGEFRFKGILQDSSEVSLRLEDNLSGEKFFMENSRIRIIATYSLKYDNSGNRIHKLKLDSLTGSGSEKMYREIQDFAITLLNGNLPDSLKKIIFYNKVKGFITKHPKHVVSPVIVRHGGILNYRQVKELYSLIDTSLHNTFEIQALDKMLSGK